MDRATEPESAELRPVRQPKDAAFLNTLSIIAHDLRGPLANLAILVELMEAYAKMQAFERVASSARKAQDTIDALSAMLNGFLERTRETGDPLAFKPGLVDLADVLGRALSLNAPMAESRQITLVTPCIGPACRSRRCPTAGGSVGQPHR